jgi:non-heme chloroperoxidase
MTAEAPESGSARTIVLVHGLWMTPLSWENWISRFEERGHRVLAPAWPGMDGEIEELRRDTSRYEGLGVTEIADHYDQIVRALEEPPIIMGHSFGGLITELLLDRGLGAAGVAVHPAPIKGVLVLPPAQLRSAWVGLRNPANVNRAVALNAKQFHYAFANTMTLEESERARQRYAIPGPARPLFQAGLANFNPGAVTKVNLHNAERAPLLLVAGSEDHTTPASTVKASFKLQRKSGAVTDYKEFPGRAHFTLGQPGWEEPADYALEWALTNARQLAAA